MMTTITSLYSTTPSNSRGIVPPSLPPLLPHNRHYKHHHIITITSLLIILLLPLLQLLLLLLLLPVLLPLLGLLCVSETTTQVLEFYHKHLSWLPTYLFHDHSLQCIGRARHLVAVCRSHWPHLWRHHFQHYGYWPQCGHLPIGNYHPGSRWPLELGFQQRHISGIPLVRPE